MVPKVAVVGAGPAGFYAAQRLLTKVKDARIDIFDKQAVPFGLVRFGVAPDHPEVKNCQERFEETAQAPNVTFNGNVEIGKDVPVKSLLDNYNAVLFSYGAQEDRKLAVPGEALPGVISARGFVGWYNGDPAWQHLNPPLHEVEDISIVGNGNVALDVARMLLRSPTELRATDITENALATLARSKVRSVSIVGRRGVLQSSFTNKELRELLREPGVTFRPLDLHSLEIDGSSIGRAEKRKLDLLLAASKKPLKEIDKAPKTWQLDFYRSPIRFNGSSSDPALLDSIDWGINEPDAVPGGMAVKKTSESVTTVAQLAFVSIGYTAHALSGMSEAGISFDARNGIIQTTKGRVPGTNAFAAGWIGTGPTGVIASTMMNSFAVGEEIASYLEQHRNDKRPGKDGLKIDPCVTSWEDWQHLDYEEKRRGQARGKPREKFTATDDMINFLK